MRGKRKQSRLLRDQASTEGVAKLSTVALQVPLGEGQGYVQGHCRVATANSFWANAQFAYGELNRVNGQ